MLKSFPSGIDPSRTLKNIASRIWPDQVCRHASQDRGPVDPRDWLSCLQGCKTNMDLDRRYGSDEELPEKLYVILNME